MADNPIDAAFEEWQKKPFDPKYFIPNTGMPMAPEQYSVRSFSVKNGYSLQQEVLFNDTMANYGLVLQADDKGETLDCAVLGFNLVHSRRVAEGAFVLGGKRRYKQLTPVRWDFGLIGTLIDFSGDAGLDAVAFRSSRDFGGLTPVQFEKLERRYEDNLREHGFRYSSLMGSFLLNLPHKRN
ncbi:hypothetical protein JW707_02715 [Candidatus Woesearchaeota archaeon]|nr:hypothetical protein [Candidatus Woesearchaeota archaeon]